MKRTILLFTGLILAAYSYSQRTAYEVSISKEFFKKLEISIVPQLRLRETFETKEYFFDAGMEYQLIKHLSLGASYRYGINVTKKGNKEPFGRYSFDATTKFKLMRFEPSLRARYSNTDDYSPDNLANTNYLRYKLGLDYNIKGLKLTPYASVEYFQNVDLKQFDQMRLEGGLEYKFNKHHRLGAYYRTNRSLINDTPVDYIGVMYKLKL